MLSDDVLRQKLAALPEPVLKYIYSEQAGDLNTQIIDRNDVSDAQRMLLFEILSEIFVKELSLESLAPTLKARLGVDDAKAERLAVDIAGYRLLPLDKWIGDVSGYIRRHGADLDAYPSERIVMVERTRDEAADDVINATALASAASARLKGRLQDVIESFLAGVRTEEQAQEVLLKPEKIGGIGLDADVARRLITEAKAEARSVIIKSRPAGGEVPHVSGEAAPSVAVAPAPKPKADFATITPEDEKEIEKIELEVLPAKGVEKADEVARSIEASIEEIYQASGLKTEDEAMAKRIKTVIANRVRDVRDQMETLETMVQPKELGGLGLSQDAARAVLNAIQTKLRSVHDEHAVKVMTEKTEWVEKEKSQKLEGEAEAKRNDQTDLESLYQSIVSKSKKAVRNAPPATAPALTASASAPAQPVSAVPPNLPIATTNPVPPELRAPAVVPLPEPPAPQPKTAAPPLTIVRPTPGVAVMPQVQGAGLGLKPRMDDVKPVARLTGPVEELRAINIVDFRRLSKDPAEACVKIKDKIDVLAEQSYTRRNEAIAAWGASEVVRTYLELMGEGLNGLPLKDAVAARLAARKPYLTPEEFQAVAALSRQLRY
ncbi:MAG TPA: hypothetical protein VJ694_04415 [Patescibacteria group bacterium]|nr:hypothetical protein [Patescibacteria group bacterium]